MNRELTIPVGGMYQERDWCKVKPSEAESMGLNVKANGTDIWQAIRRYF